MKKSLADQAYEKIKNEVITCELDPGAQIAQSQLVERYGLGLTPTREALKRLELEGYVQSIPRFGYVVSPISVTDVREIYELRLILEKSAVGLAAERITEEQLAHLLRVAGFTYTYKDRQSYKEFLDHNAEFHVLIAQATGNRRLCEMIKKLLEDMTRIFHLGLDVRDSAEEMRDEHVALAAALQKKDGTRAERLMEEQITRSQGRVLEMLQERMQSEKGAYLPPLNSFQIVD